MHSALVQLMPQQLVDAVGVSARAVDIEARCAKFTCSCEALRSVLTDSVDNPAYLQTRRLLVKHRLARASLKELAIVVDSQLVRKFIDQHCGLSSGVH